MASSPPPVRQQADQSTEHRRPRLRERTDPNLLYIIKTARLTPGPARTPTNTEANHEPRLSTSGRPWRSLHRSPATSGSGDRRRTAKRHATEVPLPPLPRGLTSMHGHWLKHVTATQADRSMRRYTSPTCRYPALPPLPWLFHTARPGSSTIARPNGAETRSPDAHVLAIIQAPFRTLLHPV